MAKKVDPKLQRQIEKVENQLKEIAWEIIDDIDLTDEFEDKYSCFISKELYDEYCKLLDKNQKLHQKR